VLRTRGTIPLGRPGAATRGRSETADVRARRPAPGDDHARPAGRRPGRTAPADGLLAQLSRAVVVGPIARLELIPCAGPQGCGENPDSIIEAQIPAQQFREMGFREGETLLVTPRRARVFVEAAA